MSSQETEQPIHTQGLVGDYFTVESHMLSTRSADAFKAIDKTRGTSICLWMLRHPLSINSDAVRRFLARMNAIDFIDPVVSDMTAYGVDAEGMAFATFPSLDGFSVDGGTFDAQEGERRFLACLRLVDRLHTAKVICGDICAASFWIRRDGEVRFLGIMGSYDAEAASTAMAPPNETLPFLAPEQRGGGSLGSATDVFALGVLGYRLLTRSYPFGEGMQSLTTPVDPEKIPPISTLINIPPVWADQVLRRCLQPDPEKRYVNAGEMLAAIQEIKMRVYSEESAPVKDRSTGKPAVISTQASSRNAHQQPGAGVDKEPVSSNTALILMVSLVSVLGIFCGYLVLNRLGYLTSAPVQSQKIVQLQDELSRHREVVTDAGLRDAIDVIGADNSELRERARELQNVVKSDDPIAHDILVKSAINAEDEQFRQVAEGAIIKRARRLGLTRSAEQVRQWLRRVKSIEGVDAYSPVLQTLDKFVPVDAREAALRRAYASDPDIALRLAISSAIDLDALDQMQAVISQLVGDSLNLESAKSHSALGLALAHPDLAMIFGEDVVQLRDRLPDSDLLWLLEILADRNDINVRAMASIAVERGVLSPVRASFLNHVRDRSDLSPDLLMSLIRAAGGVLRPEDVAAFGRWYDVAVEDILLAVLAEYDDREVALEALDTLLARDLTKEPAASLVKWVRENYWDDRADFAHPIGILGQLDRVNDEQIEKAFQNFDRFVRDSDLVDILLESGDPLITRLVIRKYPDLLGLGTLLSILDNADKQVRMLAVRALKKYNDIGALKLIIDAYERERDEEVRQVYRETFWVIQEREAKK